MNHKPGNPTPLIRRWLKTHEVIEHTGWSKSTIYRYVEEGLLRPQRAKENGNYLFDRLEVEKIIGGPLM